MTTANKSQYIADVKVMNYLLQAIPNDIYNSVDACKNAKEIWERIKRLMFSSDVTSHVRHSRLMDKFDKFAAKEGESLESVYERLTTLMNIMDRNNVRPIPVSINTKFLNSSKAKKAAKNHDPLALLVYSNASSSQSHKNSSYSPQPYYVTDPSSVVDYKDEYQGELQGDSQEDNLTTAMMLLARAITQKFSTPTNNHLRTSSNTRNQAVIQDGRVDIQTKNEGYGGNGHYACDCQKPRVRDAKYFREQMLLAMKDEAGSNLNNEENDFMLDTSYGEKTMEELTVAVMLMARIQPADRNTKIVPSYNAKVVSSQSIQIIHMLGKKPNKVYDPFLKAGLGYKNTVCLKKAIASQPKVHDGEMLHSAKLNIDSPESRLKMRNKMVQLNYGKLNALYETFVPQKEFFVEKTYFSIPSTSNNSSESKEVTSKVHYRETNLMNLLITFIRSRVIWERVHDFQLGIESYQIKVNLTAPTLTYPGIEAYEPYSIVDKPNAGLIYLNIKDEKRVMYLVEIVKFCDATLEKVLKEVKLKIYQSEPWKKPPLLGELDHDIMRAFEREITKRLSHQEQMRRWESFVNRRPILQTIKRL
ncbi:hypothetical protein Tco_0154823 [Tanacetum coccineum]